MSLFCRSLFSAVAVGSPFAVCGGGVGSGGREEVLLIFLRVALFVVVLVALVSRFAVLCGGLGGGSSVLRIAYLERVGSSLFLKMGGGMINGWGDDGGRTDSTEW